MKNIAVLVVEDMLSWRRMYEKLLIASGFSCETAESLDQAKEKLNEKSFDLAILDMRLVGNDEKNSDGMDVIAWLENHNRATKVIVCTGFATSERVKKAYSSGRILDFIEKDEFDASKLITIINNMVIE